MIKEFVEIVTNTADDVQLTGTARVVFYALSPFFAVLGIIGGVITVVIDEIKDRFCN